MSCRQIQFFSGYKKKNNIDDYVIQKSDFSSKKVFTSFATVTNPEGSVQVLFLEKHLDRLFENSEKADLLREDLLEHSRSWIKSTTLKCLFDYIAETKEKRIQARLTLSSQGLEITLRKCPNTWLPDKKVTLKSVTQTRVTPHLKLTNVEISQAANLEAKKAGKDHALLIKDDETVTECDWANIFWFNKDGELHTSKECALPGITQASILEEASKKGQNILSTKINLKDLKQMSSMFITKSSTGIEFVESIDDSPLLTKDKEKKLALSLIKSAASRDASTII